ncbi:peptidase M52 [Mycobacterium paragordonae]|uniref:hydrogenase maturation protease n=1 Tax=Mycobacterium paragordonae TaxID=1389713 RepID=UPI0007EF1689|nr:MULTISPECIES: hydrogenase maturation protease [Mycobacterium]AYE95860.1 peptidase M52 [Mycobacterium paragordonae]OBK48753.1 peptidase M52 [Mycobacterium gordonae]
MTGRVVVIGLGNRYRRDDALGVTSARALGDLALPGVEIVTDIVDPLTLLDVWSGARLAVIIDAAVTTGSAAGHIRCCDLDELLSSAKPLSSHSIDVGRTYELGQALGRVPEALQIYAVDVADTDHGIGFTAQVEQALPRVVALAAAEINRVTSFSA